MTIFDAAERYRSEGVPLVILAGASYGQGSSRDWAAKGPLLLGVRAVLAKSFERIHRGNLVGMGVMPIVFRPAEGASELGLTGQESYTISIPAGTPLLPKCDVLVRAEHPDGKVQTFTAKCRIDSPAELEYYESGGILPVCPRPPCGVGLGADGRRGFRGESGVSRSRWVIRLRAATSLRWGREVANPFRSHPGLEQQGRVAHHLRHRFGLPGVAPCRAAGTSSASSRRISSSTVVGAIPHIEIPWSRTVS